MNIQTRSTTFHRRNLSLSQRYSQYQQHRHSLRKVYCSPPQTPYSMQPEAILINAKNEYYHNKNMKAAAKLFEQYLVIEPNHQQALYLSAVALLQINSPQKAIEKLVRLKHKALTHQNFKSFSSRKILSTKKKGQTSNYPNILLLLALAYSKINQINQSFETINQCLKKYPDFEEGYCFRAKLQLKLGLVNKAENDFKQMLYCTPDSWLGKIGLADCHRLSDRLEEALRNYQEAYTLLIKNKKQENISNINQVRLKRGICLFNLNKFAKAQAEFKQLLTKKSDTLSEVYYFLAQVQLKLDKIQEAMLNLQYSLRSQSNKNIMKKSLALLLKILIEKNQFYEATNAIALGKMFKVQCKIEEKLIQGCLAVMKKKYEQGQQMLQKLKNKLKQQEQSIAKIQKKQGQKLESIRYKKTDISPNILSLSSEKDNQQFTIYMPFLLNFLAYAYFFQDNFGKCLETYDELESFNRNFLGKDSKDIQINKNLCEGLLMLESQMYEQCLEKFAEVQELSVKFSSKTPIQAILYRIIGLIRLAYGSCPIYGDLQTKDQIIDYSLQYVSVTISTLTNMSPKQQNYILYYYKGLLHAAKKQYENARNQINKALNVCQDCSWQILYAKGVTQMQIHEYNTAIKQFTAGMILSQTCPDLFLGRCIAFLLEYYRTDNADMMQHSFEDLQKFIEYETSQQRISTWVSKILFYNKAYEQAIKSLEKVNSYDSDLLKMEECLRIFNGDFSEGGIQGQIIVDAFLGTLDQQFYDEKNKEKSQALGYLYPNYVKWLKILNLYARQSYNDLVKLFQKYIFETSNNQEQLQMRYNIAIIYLLIGQYGKAQKVFSCISGFSQSVNQKVQKIINYQIGNDECIDDLSLELGTKRLSSYLPYREAFIVIPKTGQKIRVFLKISIPFPQFPRPQIILSIQDSFIIHEARQNIVEKKITAPWIRLQQKKLQFTDQMNESECQNVDVDDSQINTIALKSENHEDELDKFQQKLSQEGRNSESDVNQFTL